jgi:ApaG protein
VPQAQLEQIIPACRGSACVTNGIRVEVRPRYVEDQSDPAGRQWLFSYRIRIANEGVVPVKLESRHWHIVDAVGNPEEVRGPGVVGQQPRLEPGHSFEYSSYCQLRTSWGTMEGAYRLRTDEGEAFDVRIGRFILVGPQSPRR